MGGPLLRILWGLLFERSARVSLPKFLWGLRSCSVVFNSWYIWCFWRKLQIGLINLRVLPTRTYIEYPYWFSLWSPYCFWIASLLCSLLSQNYPNLSDGLVCNCKQCSRKSCHCILVLSSCDEEGLIIFSSLLSDRFTFVAFSPQILCGKRYQYNGNIIKVSTVLNI